MIRPPSSTGLQRQTQKAHGQHKRNPHRVRPVKLGLEALEDRTLLNATVTSVTTTMASNSIVSNNQTATVVVNFSEAVTVTGFPLLTMSDSANSTARYSSGSGTSALQFTFVIVGNDSAQPLDYASTSALALNGGTITGTDSNPATLTLPTPGGSGDGLFIANLTVDSPAPQVMGVEPGSVSSGTYGAGAVITIELVFNKDVFVTGTPRLALNSGGAAYYTSGTGTPVLTFTYTVQPGDNTNGASLDIGGATALTLNGGSINDADGLAAGLTLPTAGSGFDDLPGGEIIINATSQNSSPPPSTSPPPLSNPLAGIQQEIQVFIAQTENLLSGNLPSLLNGFQGFASSFMGEQVQLIPVLSQLMVDVLFETALLQSESLHLVVSTMPP